MDAVDDLRDSIEATRNFLTPVRAGVWLRLAIVALFVGGFGTGFPSIPSGDVGPAEEQAPDVGTEALPEDVLVAVAVALGFLFLVWLIFAFISAIMEFVFIESLRSMDVRVRRYSNENVGRGIRLFGFRVFLVLTALLIGGTPVAATLLGLDGLEGAAGTVIAALFAIAVYVVYAIVNRFTSEFVAPVMLLEGRGVLSAWRRFWSTLGSNWAEYAVYLILVWIIQAAVGLAVGILMLTGGIVVAIPFVLLAAAFVLLLGDIGAVLAAIVVLAGVVAFALFALLVQVPVVSYFKYYALLLLGDTNAELDLIPDQRAAIRTDGGEAASGADYEEPTTPADRWERDDEGTDREEPESENDWRADYGWTDEDGMDDWDDADLDDREDREGSGRNGDRDEDDDRGW